MKVKLEMEFENLSELRTYLDSTVQQGVSVTPMNESAGASTVTTGSTEVLDQVIEASAPVQVAPVEAPATPPPMAEAPAPSPVEPVPTTAPTEPTPEPVPTQEVSTAAVSYTLDDLAKAGSELLEQGKQKELPGLLQRFGITSLPELPKDQYADFALALREMGAKI